VRTWMAAVPGGQGSELRERGREQRWSSGVREKKEGAGAGVLPRGAGSD